MAMKYAVIMNPRSANGRTAKAWGRVESLVRSVIGDFALLLTERPGHAPELVRNALKNGASRIVSVGGDGTIHEIANGFFDGEDLVNPEASLAIVPMGTGSDLARTLNLASPEQAIARLASADTTAIDVGRFRYTTDQGERLGYFVNAAHIGMGAAVGDRVNRTTKAFGGFASFLWGVMATMLTYRNPSLVLDIDGRSVEGRCNDIIFANGRYDGGGMHVAPRARLDSGTLEVFVIGDIGRIEGFRNIPLLYQGRLVDHPDRVSYYQARRITARSEERVYVNLDGEVPGYLPASVEVVPSAIPLVFPAAAASPSAQ